MSSTSWLITGANRGIGYGIVSALIQRPNTTVVAAVRDPTSAAKGFDDLARKAAAGSKIIVVKVTSTSDTDAKTAMGELKQQGINKLDVVIANAGLANYYGPVISTPIDQLHEHLTVNTVGLVILFQAVWPLLEQSNTPKFVYISSSADSVSVGAPIPNCAYGASKAAGSYLTVKIHQEHPSLTSFVLHPGLIETDMGIIFIKGYNHTFTGDALAVDQSVAGILTHVDAATRENSGGTFKDFLHEDCVNLLNY